MFSRAWAQLILKSQKFGLLQKRARGSAISGNRNRETILNGAELGHGLVVDFKVGVNVLNVVVVFKRRHQFED